MYNVFNRIVLVSKLLFIDGVKFSVAHVYRKKILFIILLFIILFTQMWTKIKVADTLACMPNVAL